MAIAATVPATPINSSNPQIDTAQFQSAFSPRLDCQPKWDMQLEAAGNGPIRYTGECLWLPTEAPSGLCSRSENYWRKTTEAALLRDSAL
jgi:hypothetical protein